MLTTCKQLGLITVLQHLNRDAHNPGVYYVVSAWFDEKWDYALCMYRADTGICTCIPSRSLAVLEFDHCSSWAHQYSRHQYSMSCRCAVYSLHHRSTTLAWNDMNSKNHIFLDVTKIFPDYDSSCTYQNSFHRKR